jgi:predicted phage-related endonuclease
VLQLLVRLKRKEKHMEKTITIDKFDGERITQKTVLETRMDELEQELKELKEQVKHPKLESDTNKPFSGNITSDTSFVPPKK